MTLLTTCFVGACTLFLITGCRNPATRADFASLVDIGGGRKMFMECRGTGSPTVVLVSGTQGASDDWTFAADPTDPAGHPKLSGSAVFPLVSTFTRVCAYDRPGTPRFDGVLSSSTPVRQPTTTQDGVADRHALLNAANEPGPYILVGASWGGMIVKLYASTYPDDVSGLVFVDAASEFLKTTLTSAQWAGWMQKAKTMIDSRDLEVPDYEPSVEEVRVASPVQSVTAVVLTAVKPGIFRLATVVRPGRPGWQLKIISRPSSSPGTSRTQTAAIPSALSSRNSSSKPFAKSSIQSTVQSQSRHRERSRSNSPST